MAARRIGSCLLLGLALPAAARADPARPFSINVEPSYFGGTFGTSNTVSVYEVPVTFEYHGARLRMRLEIPYIALTGAGLLSGGSVIQTSGHPVWRTGLGDIWVGGDYRVLDTAGYRPSVRPYVKVKIPTASRAQGLGTGRPDIEFGSHFEWNLDGRILPYARAGYRVVGQAPGLKLRNAFTFEAGASVVVPHHGYVTALFLDSGTLQRGAGPAEQLIGAYTVRLTAALEFQTYLTRGLTPNSPAFGAGMGLTEKF
ncbi:hypothetical protein GCM10010909_31520 [Acidocella aquatica]|uniref:Transporter n=1 Tax=Acidocella aquatica TaxID=1922313 RepID=A0ABQ6A990_9PROT|nr:hypothetical protein [Acidocella aquatica]GLR68471.1 hypothetical protein GCM10010909_31520 [Acidocella aquatica]